MMHHLDQIAKDNQTRWNAIVKAGSEYTRPFFDLTPVEAEKKIENDPTLAKAAWSDVRGKDVLCLAGSGGQQSVLFALAGAYVTVLDLSDAQLARDREAAQHHNISIRIEHGDMRDLSRFSDASFDLVYQPYSINFVPDPVVVIREVARVLRRGGVYRLDFSNPFWSMEESDWTEKGYPIREPYVSGKPLEFDNPNWDVQDADGNWHKVQGPHEFMHTLSTILNALIENDLQIFHFDEFPKGDNSAEPGTWEHLCSIVPPFMTVGSMKKPSPH